MVSKPYERNPLLPRHSRHRSCHRSNWCQRTRYGDPRRPARRGAIRQRRPRHAFPARASVSTGPDHGLGKAAMIRLIGMILVGLRASLEASRCKMNRSAITAAGCSFQPVAKRRTCPQPRQKRVIIGRLVSLSAICLLFIVGGAIQSTDPGSDEPHWLHVNGIFFAIAQSVNCLVTFAGSGISFPFSRDTVRRFACSRDVAAA